MTSARSAAATGLPDRRHFLSTIAGAGALGLPVLPALAAAPGHSDAALLHLDTLLATAIERGHELDAACDAAYERFVPPPLPDALFWRRSDHLAVWVDRQRLDSIGDPDDDRYVYASPGILKSLKARRAEWLRVDPIDRSVGDRTIARVEEIIAHLEAYGIEEERRYAACGATAAQAECDAQYDMITDLVTRMANIPARTAEGVCAKVRAALVASYRSADLIETGCLATLLARANRTPHDTAEMLTLSAMVDAAKFGTAAHSSERRAA